VEASKRDGYTFTIGESTGAYKFDDDILGMKTGDKKTVEKVFPTDGEDKENAGKALKFDLTIKSLKKRDLPELTDDFAQDVDEKFKTMDDLRAGIKDRMRKHLEDTEKALKINALYKALMEKNPVDIPESMIRIETESRYRSFAQRMGIDPAAMARSLTDADYERSRPEITNTVHSTLLMQKLLEQLQIEPSQADIDAEIKRVAGEAGQTEEEVRKYYVDENGQTNEYVKDEIRQRLLNDKLLAENTVNTGKTVSFDELLKEVHGGAN
jgi:trigger factor